MLTPQVKRRIRNWIIQYSRSHPDRCIPDLRSAKETMIRCASLGDFWAKDILAEIDRCRTFCDDQAECTCDRHRD